MEASPPGGTGVQKKPVAGPVGVTAVAMAEDEDIPAIRGCIGKPVDDGDLTVFGAEGGGRGKRGGLAGGIVVAADGGEGGEAGKRFEDTIADIARVEDVVTSGEGGEGIFTKKAVGIGDESEQHLSQCSEHCRPWWPWREVRAAGDD
jgi:hypothetical protein